MVCFKTIRQSTMDQPSFLHAWAFVMLTCFFTLSFIIISYTSPMLLAGVIPLSFKHLSFHAFPFVQPYYFAFFPTVWYFFGLMDFLHNFFQDYSWFFVSFNEPFIWDFFWAQAFVSFQFLYWFIYFSLIWFSSSLSMWWGFQAPCIHMFYSVCPFCIFCRSFYGLV